MVDWTGLSPQSFEPVASSRGAGGRVNSATTMSTERRQARSFSIGTGTSNLAVEPVRSLRSA